MNSTHLQPLCRERISKRDLRFFLFLFLSLSPHGHPVSRWEFHISLDLYTPTTQCSHLLPHHGQMLNAVTTMDRCSMQSSSTSPRADAQCSHLPPHPGQMLNAVIFFLTPDRCSMQSSSSSPRADPQCSHLLPHHGQMLNAVTTMDRCSMQSSSRSPRTDAGAAAVSPAQE